MKGKSHSLPIKCNIYLTIILPLSHPGPPVVAVLLSYKYSRKQG